MTGTKFAFLVVAAFASTLSVQEAFSFNPTAGVLKESAVASSLKQKAHGCHYFCECCSLRDFGCEQVYHRHLHMLCLPVPCRDKDCEPTPSKGVCRHIAPRVE